MLKMLNYFNTYTYRSFVIVYVLGIINKYRYLGKYI